jgi:hypothetical protein
MTKAKTLRNLIKWHALDFRAAITFFTENDDANLHNNSHQFLQVNELCMPA